MWPAIAKWLTLTRISKMRLCHNQKENALNFPVIYHASWYAISDPKYRGISRNILEGWPCWHVCAILYPMAKKSQTSKFALRYGGCPGGGHRVTRGHPGHPVAPPKEGYRDLKLGWHEQFSTTALHLSSVTSMLRLPDNHQIRLRSSRHIEEQFHGYVSFELPKLEWISFNF